MEKLKEEIKLPNHAAQVLAAFSLENGEPDSLLWKIDKDGIIKFYVNCSDFFAWATADAEEIEEDDIDLLYQCLNDLKQYQDYFEVYLAELFVARKRNQKPMKAWLEHENLTDHSLFNNIGETNHVV